MSDIGVKLKTKCEDCNKEFTVTATGDVKVQRKEFEINGENVMLTYYDCPNCGKRHFVQVDDDKSLSRFRIISKMFRKLTKARTNYDVISKKKSAEFNEARQYLAVYRKKLQDKCTGKLIHDNETDKNYVLKFSEVKYDK